jgi:hypothetical protein
MVEGITKERLEQIKKIYNSDNSLAEEDLSDFLLVHRKMLELIREAFLNDFKKRIVEFTYQDTKIKDKYGSKL